MGMRISKGEMIKDTIIKASLTGSTIVRSAVITTLVETMRETSSM